MFIDAYLGLIATFGSGSATEVAVGGYNRQPISFSVPTDGACTNATSWSFGNVFAGAVQPTLAGLGIYESASAGRLLLAWPFSVPRQFLPNYPPRSGDTGTLRLTFAALQSIRNGAAFTGNVPATTVIGQAWDDLDQVGHYADPGGVVPTRQFAKNALSSGVGLALVRGLLSGAAQ